MNAQECLVDAARAIIAGCYKDAELHMSDYVTWRNMKGAEPNMHIMMGDPYHRGLVELYEKKFGAYKGLRLP